MCLALYMLYLIFHKTSIAVPVPVLEMRSLRHEAVRPVLVSARERSV